MKSFIRETVVEREEKKDLRNDILNQAKTHKGSTGNASQDAKIYTLKRKIENYQKINSKVSCHPHKNSSILLILTSYTFM